MQALHRPGSRGPRCRDGAGLLTGCASPTTRGGPATRTTRIASLGPVGLRPPSPGEGTHYRVYDKLGRPTRPGSRASTAPSSRCGLPTPGASASSGTGTSGTVVGTPCACTPPTGSGSCSFPASDPAPTTSTRSWGPAAISWRSRPIPWPCFEPGGERIGRRVSTTSTATARAISRGWPSASAGSRSGCRSASTRSTSAHGGACQKRGSRWLSYRELADQLGGLRDATWASPTSS